MPSKPNAILGLSVGHGDSSAALIVDGVLVAAVEEERFNRIKHYGLFPERSIQYCLQVAGLAPSAVGTVAIARNPWNAFPRKLGMALRYPSLFQSRNRRKEASGPKISVDDRLKALGLTSAKLVRVEHHLAHLHSARPLSEAERVALFSFDGLGDFVSAAFGVAEGTQVKILSRIYFPHSVGFFYTALTQYLGFPHYGDEFKVMGLSSYGNPTYLPLMHELITETPEGFQLNLEAFPLLSRPMRFTLEGGRPAVSSLYSERILAPLLGLPPRQPGEELTDKHRDLAKSVQARFEQIASHLLGILHRKVGGKHVALAGGCAHNSVWVGKIPSTTPFSEVAVAPASSDAGIAVGAAVAAFGGVVKPQGNHWALMGPAGDEALHLRSEEKGKVNQKEFPSEEALIAWMVDRLAEGKIFGLFHGRMEFGPRALGSRSILADPRHPQMRDRLNLRVKHRETFRPFAASVLWEHQSQWFDGAFFCPSMEAVFNVKESMRSKIPAVVHHDQTCRIQSVTQDTQPFYWKLIDGFRKKTGVPMLINTSFNDSEPIVCTPRDAFQCFLGSDLDFLVVDRTVYTKAEALALTA